jgi:hypothetical protein
VSALRARLPLMAWPSVSDPWPLLAVPLALAAGWLFTTHPRLIQLAALLVLAVPLVVSPRTRILFVIVGTLTIFGPAELTDAKLLFLFGATIAIAGAFIRSRSLVRTPAYADLRPLLRASAALLLVVAISLPVAHFNGVAEKEWLRDVAAYVLVAWAPLFALDAQAAFGTRALYRLIAAAGLIGATGFMTKWLVGREISSSISGEIVLSTFLLGAALFSVAMAMALDGERSRIVWLTLGAIVLAMMATTGTRSSLVYLAAPIVILIGTRRHLARRSLRLLVVVPIAGLLVGIGVYSLLRVVQADESVVTGRFELLFQSGDETDQSYVARRNQARGAWSEFRSAPLLGSGPGHKITWRDSRGGRVTSATSDTPVAFLADYGLAGAVAVAFLVAAFVSVARRIRRRAGGRTTVQLALIGFAAVVAGYGVLQVPFEDKGLSVGLLLLLAVATRDASDRAAGAGAPSALA